MSKTAGFTLGSRKVIVQNQEQQAELNAFLARLGTKLPPEARLPIPDTPRYHLAVRRLSRFISLRDGKASLKLPTVGDTHRLMVVMVSEDGNPETYSFSLSKSHWSDFRIISNVGLTHGSVKMDAPIDVTGIVIRTIVDKNLVMKRLTFQDIAAIIPFSSKQST